ncbi:MAG: aminoacyl-tRNA hydrolase [Ignavibacteriales bacterium]|jgi:PTH1 family peptidyl-tRNA hydrolase
MILVAGLGNPGKEYSSSRHNVGFIVVDEIAKRLGISLKKKGFRSLFAEALLEEKKIILLKPQTYMNLSGDAVSDAVEFFKISLKDIIVVHDEIDLPLGSMKIKTGGGSAGHKGVRSIVNCLGDSGFVRVRVGVGKPLQKSEVIGHVLSGFGKEEKRIMEDMVVRAADAVLEIILRGLESAMNKFNRKDAEYKTQDA